VGTDISLCLVRSVDSIPVETEPIGRVVQSDLVLFEDSCKLEWRA
jgi:hypothetical protein